MRRSGNSRSSWTGFKKSPGCRGRRTTRVDRSWTFGIERCATVPVERTVKDGPVLRAARRERAESQADAAFGRAVHKDALLRRCENDRRASQARLYRQSETSPAITAADGIGSDLSETAAVGACAWSSHLSVPAAPRWYYATQSSFVERLWRTVKYEDVYLKDYSDPPDAVRNLRLYFSFYNGQRPHQALNYQTPEAVYFGVNAQKPAMLRVAFAADRRL